MADKEIQFRPPSPVKWFGWMGFWFFLTIMLFWQAAPIGKILGILFLFFAVRNAWRLVQFTRHGTGVIHLKSDSVHLPHGQWNLREEISSQDIRSAVILHRAKPTSLTAPVLAVETSARTFLYPRDWFRSGAHQRQVVEHLRPWLEKHSS